MIKIILVAVSMVLLISGCNSDPQWVQSYKKCKQTMEKEAEKMRESVPKDMDESPFGKPLAGLMVGMGEGLAGEVCEAIKQVCEKDPEGQGCRAVMKVEW